MKDMCRQRLLILIPSNLDSFVNNDGQIMGTSSTDYDVQKILNEKKETISINKKVEISNKYLRRAHRL